MRIGFAYIGISTGWSSNVALDLTHNDYLDQLPFLLSFYFVFNTFNFSFKFLNMFANANVDPVLPSSKVEDTLRAADVCATGDARATGIEINRGVPGWSVIEYKTRYADTLDARRFGAMFLDESNAFMVDRRNVRRDTDIGAWERPSTLLRRWCPGTLKDVFGFDMPIIRHEQKVNYLRCLLRLVRNVSVTFEYRGLDLCCFDTPMDGFYLVKEADTWWRELKFEGWQRHHARGPRSIGWHNLEMFALPPVERNDFYTPVPNDWSRESNRVLRVPTPELFLYLSDYFRISFATVREHLGRIAEVEKELTTLGAFHRIVRYGVVNRLALDNITRVCGNEGVLFRVDDDTI